MLVQSHLFNLVKPCLPLQKTWTCILIGSLLVCVLGLPRKIKFSSFKIQILNNNNNNGVCIALFRFNFPAMIPLWVSLNFLTLFIGLIFHL